MGWSPSGWRRVGSAPTSRTKPGISPLLIGDSKIEVGKTRCIVGPVVGGDIHPEKHDLGAGLEASTDDLAEVLLGVFQWLAAERVVAAEFDNEDFGRSLEDPIDSGKATGRGVAADSGIDDRDIVSLGSEEGFRDRGEGLGLGETEPRGQAIAEYDDAEFGLDLDNRYDRR